MAKARHQGHQVGHQDEEKEGEKKTIGRVKDIDDEVNHRDQANQEHRRHQGAKDHLEKEGKQRKKRELSIKCGQASKQERKNQI